MQPRGLQNSMALGCFDDYTTLFFGAWCWGTKDVHHVKAQISVQQRHYNWLPLPVGVFWLWRISLGKLLDSWFWPHSVDNMTLNLKFLECFQYFSAPNLSPLKVVPLSRMGRAVFAVAAAVLTLRHCSFVSPSALGVETRAWCSKKQNILHNLSNPPGTFLSQLFLTFFWYPSR